MRAAFYALTLTARQSRNDVKGIASGDLQVASSNGSVVAALAFQNLTLGAGAFHVTSDGAGWHLTHTQLGHRARNARPDPSKSCA
jgi:hypothetical protein